MEKQRIVEEQHLAFVYQKLVTRQQALRLFLDKGYASHLQDLQAIGSDIRLNFDNLSDSLETYAAIESKNREIDQMNLSLQSAEKELATIERLLKSPYFGKIAVDFLDGEAAESFYIGINGFADEDSQNLIYDWRSPIAELFYNNTLGASSYQVNDQRIPVSIENRRQLIVDQDQLLRFFDTSVAIQDEVLLTALEKNDGKKMRDITASIQREQNAVIRDQSSQALLVNGVAGSGKTSVIMQRVAYLLYQYRSQITSDNVLILSPNQEFIHYISDVLPSLGEKNPLNQTIRQFCSLLLQETKTAPLENEAAYFARLQAPVSFQTKTIRSNEFIDFLQEAANQTLHNEPRFHSILRKGKVVIAKETIQSIYRSTPHLPLIERLQATKKRLISAWEAQIMRNAKKSQLQDQVLALSEQQQLRYFGHLIEDDSPAGIQTYTEQLLRIKYRVVDEQLKGNRWIDEEQFLEHYYTAFTQQPYLKHSTVTLDEAVVRLFIRHRFIEKLPVPSLAFLLIDEIQDYTPAQCRLLLTLFPRAAFTMVGDENQAIFNSAIAFSEIQKIFESQNRTLQRYDLRTSYRSSGEITRLFAELVTKSTMSIVPIRPAGEIPRFLRFDHEEKWLSVIMPFIQTGRSYTILTKSAKEAAFLEKQFRETGQMPLAIYSIDIAKGREFDHVILYDISKEKFQTAQDKRILYTLLSRSMESILVTYKNELSDFFKSNHSLRTKIEK
ncbi:UvrD-helicase domain-containing protein [Enterococcus sp.]|uniref:HelD family protein n=1 Tax=Enterococcus sp. TaxID=35783 RepID=UPI0025C6C8DE|nr:UvrD-helicase domain-containing protein [Enterococcus sp.]